MRIFIFILAVCFGLSESYGAYGQSPPKRVALVIGNSDYIGATPDLPNPVNDAALMAETLGALGFDVDVRTDLSRAEMDEAFRAHRDRLSAGGPNAVGLFYYAGHGVQLDDANYFIPVSSTARFRQDVRGEPQLGTAISYMREAGNAVNIVIVDACKDSPYPDRVGIGRTAAGKGGLSTPGRSEGVFIAYAAQPGQTAADGVGANSPFAAALADVMQVPGLDLDDVFQEIAWRVVDQSGGEQWPYYSSGLIGQDVCLAGCERAAPQPLLASDEGAALAQAYSLDTIEGYEEFERRFPYHPQLYHIAKRKHDIEKGLDVNLDEVAGLRKQIEGDFGLPTELKVGEDEEVTLVLDHEKFLKEHLDVDAVIKGRLGSMLQGSEVNDKGVRNQNTRQDSAETTSSDTEEKSLASEALSGLFGRKPETSKDK